MKKIIYPLLVTAAVVYSQQAVAQKLTFEYDAAGNQTSREWICVNCSTSQMMAVAAEMADTVKDVSIAEETTSPFDDLRVVSVYPNPVSETLHVTWASNLKVPVKEIYLNSTTGTLLLRQSVSPSQHEMSISFSGYPPGSYWLRALFKDGRRESIIIIKVD